MPCVKTHQASPYGKKYSLTPRETTHDQVIHLETVAKICCESWHQANYFFHSFCSSFELEGLNKHIMTSPKGNSEFCFSSTSAFIEGVRETKLTVFLVASH